jgi:hypothetical protein
MGMGWKKMKWTFTAIDELRNKEGGGEEHKEMVENEMGHGNMVLGNEELNKLHNDIN